MSVKRTALLLASMVVAAFVGLNRYTYREGTELIGTKAMEWGRSHTQQKPW